MSNPSIARSPSLLLRATALAALALSACSQPSSGGADASAAASSAAPKSSAAPSASAAAEPPALDVVAKLDGAPLVFRGATVTSKGGSSLEVELSTHALDCPKKGETMILMKDGEQRVKLTIGRSLETDGTRKSKVMNSYFAGSTRQGDQGEAQLEGDETKGVTLTLPELTLKSAGEKQQELVLSGKLAAKGCGKISDGDAAGAPQADLKFSVSGLELPVLSAKIQARDDGHELTLSTLPGDCKFPSFSADANYSLNLDAKGAVKSAFLRGGLFASQMTASPSDAKVTLGEAKDGKQEATVELAYDHLGYAVKLGGKLVADVCEK